MNCQAIQKSGASVAYAQGDISILNEKIPEAFASGIFVSVSQLFDNDNVAGLKTLGALFNSELDLLAFLQILEAFALNCREVDKDIIAAIASEEAVALRSIEPIDCTVDTFRHFCLLWQVENMEGTLGIASEPPQRR